MPRPRWSRAIAQAAAPAQKLKLQYTDLTKAYADTQAKAAESHRAEQHAMYLRSHTDRGGGSPADHPARVTSLREAGITTAADVGNAALDRVTG